MISVLAAHLAPNRLRVDGLATICRGDAMRLAGLMALSGIDRERFNTLRRRGQLPFRAICSAQEHFQTFSIDDALRARLMVMVGANEISAGLGGEEACRLVSNALGKAQGALGTGLHDMITSPATWIGAAEFEGEGRCGAIERWAGSYVGPIDGLGSWLCEEMSEFEDAYRRQRPVRLIGLVNATAAAEYVLARADEHGIDTDG